MSYKVYEYGITTITAGMDPARSQMRARAIYWNDLVTIERSFRDAMDALILIASPALASMEREIGICEAMIDADPTDDERKATLKKLYAEQKKLRKGAITACKPEIADLNRRRKDEHRAARQRAAKGEPVVIDRQGESVTVERSPLYWGNYMDVDAAYNTSRQKFGRLLKFHSAVDEDMVSIQATNGLLVADIWGNDGRVQFERPDDLAWTSPVRGERRRLARTTGRLRVGSDGKSPVWLEFVCVLHRPLPPAGVVRRVSVVVRKIGTVSQMRLLVTVETSDVPTRECQAPYIGIDIGWRRLPGKLRVAMAAGPNGQMPEEYALPAEFIQAMEKSEEIRSGRDMDFNRARANLTSWMQMQSQVPAWMCEETRYMAQWRSPGKLARLYWRWRGQRFDGDGAAFEALEAWFRHDRHLWDWEANARDQALARRKDIFRGWASNLMALANEHRASIAMEKFDLRGVIGAPDELDNAAHMRSLAGVGILRNIIRHTAVREGVPIKEVPSKNTTRTCHVCGNLQKFDAKSEIRATCSNCGEEWDQDVNAARNIIKLAQ